GSLRSAASIKRNAPSIVDAISSEDIGKFPDTNVAESLQRIPGVAIDRSNGEGRFVTVRGFGPAFNTVLVNGRTFASDNQGREFSFDLLAAELVAG
ncbi:TonB-dependent receptor plug domain-containing protein, partial [Parvimonas micra]|uniref:TonB-dependent receptor plug domain-containing protein n=1 Tax=Parvimonas micra TaxID=33033 RepID=UPI002B48F131